MCKISDHKWKMSNWVGAGVWKGKDRETIWSLYWSLRVLAREVSASRDKITCFLKVDVSMPTILFPSQYSHPGPLTLHYSPAVTLGLTTSHGLAKGILANVTQTEAWEVGEWSGLLSFLLFTRTCSGEDAGEWERDGSVASIAPNNNQPTTRHMHEPSQDHESRLVRLVSPGEPQSPELITQHCSAHRYLIHFFLLLPLIFFFQKNKPNCWCFLL